jgi:plastocyanin
MFREHHGLNLVAAALAAVALAAVALAGFSVRDTASAQDRGDDPGVPGSLQTVLDGFLGFSVETAAPAGLAARGIDGPALIVTDQGTGNNDGRVLLGTDVNDDDAITADEFQVIAENLLSAAGGGVSFSEVIMADDGTLYGVTGGIAADFPGSASLYNVTTGEILADFWAIESAPIEEGGNPDGTDVNSNPYSLAIDEDGHFLVVDAGANVIWHVAPSAEPLAGRGVPYVTTVWSLVPVLVETENPDAQAVPTGNAWGDDGFYVPTLTGEEPGAGQLLRFSETVVAGRGEPIVNVELVATNLTMPTDVDFDEGYAIVSQFSLDPFAGAPGMVSKSAEPFFGPLAARGQAPPLTEWEDLVNFAVTPTGVAYTSELKLGDTYVVEAFFGFETGGFGSRLSIVSDPAWLLYATDQAPVKATTIYIDVVTMLEPGYVVLHEGDADGFTGTVLGVSEYLEAGTYFFVPVNLTAPAVNGQVVWAMLHTEDTGNTAYDGADMDLPVVDKVSGNPDFGSIVVFPIGLILPPGEGGVLNPVLEADGPFRSVERLDDGRVMVAYQGTGNNDGAIRAGVDKNGDGVASGDEFETLVDGLPSIGKEGGVSGPNDAVVMKDGTVYGITGEAGEEPDGVFSSVWNFTTGEMIADLKAYEHKNNTDGYEEDGVPDVASNPYAIEILDPEAGLVFVSDSGANAVLIVDLNTGEITPAAIFPLIQEAPFPIQAVPTGLEWCDFLICVSFLTGGPFPQGAAGVYALSDDNGDGDAMDLAEMILVATNLTQATDVAFDPFGYLYVTQFSIDPEDEDAPGMVSRSATPLFLASRSNGEGKLGRATTRGGEGPIDEWVDLVDSAVTPTGLSNAEGTIYVNEEFLNRISVIGEGGGPEPTEVELFEGWNLVGAWPGEGLEGDDITAFFDKNVEGDWEALAYFNGEEWEQRFQDPPLPSFNTLNAIEPGADIWVFVPGDATLTIPPGPQVLEISATGLAFSTDLLQAEPGPAVVRFTNNAGFPHNFSLYADEAYSEGIAEGEIISSGTDVVDLGELTAGEYYFRCDVHPDDMQGDLIVG